MEYAAAGHLRAGRDEVQRQPDTLLAQVVRMAHPAPEAGGVEAEVVRSGKFRLLFEQLLFVLIEPPLLLVRDRFQQEETTGAAQRKRVDHAERCRRLHTRQRRQADRQHEGVLVKADE